MSASPTYERVRELLDYDPETGVFRWKIKPNRAAAVRIGDTAGTLQNGYRVIGIARRQYRAARLAVLLMRGRWPKHQVDHKNRNKSDDSWENLREATHSQNQMNKPSPRGEEIRGASIDRRSGLWTAQIQKDGINHYLGRFRTADAAHIAYRQEARRLFGQFSYRGQP